MTATVSDLAARQAAVRADDALLTALAAGLVPDPTDAVVLLLAAWRAEAWQLAAVGDPPGGLPC